MKRSLLAAAAMLAATPAFASTGNEGADAFMGLVLIGVIIAGYFLPSIVAWNRGHHQKPAIVVLNLAFGWTVLGWFAALIWANTAVVRRNVDGTVG